MMGHKLGIIPQSDLSWEYKAQIRTWLQPYIYLAIAKLYFLFEKNPFHLAFLLRLFSSILGFYSILSLSKISYLLIKEETINNFFKITLFSFWFFPFFHARTTTENFSTTFLILGIIPIIKFNLSENNKVVKESILSGIMLGFSYIFRFQSALAFCLPLLMTIKKGKQGKQFFFYSSVFIIILLLVNIYIDYLGHGELSFTTWNYFYQNLILKVANGFGTSPWYYYFSKTFLESGPPLGLFLVIAPILLLFYAPLNICNFIIWPFLIVHSLIGHKELRFIFPLLPFAILSLFCLIEIKYETIKKILCIKILQIFIYLCCFLNLILLTISIFRPAFGPIKMYKYMYYSNEEINNIYTLGVFRDQLRFYLKHPFTQTEINLSKSLNIIDENSKSQTKAWFLTDHLNDRNRILERSSCHEMYMSYPNWVFRFNYFNWINRSKTWSLIKCQ